MGRPGVFGRELILNSNGRFVGCNIGYNFYSEHEHGLGSITKSLMDTARPTDIRFLRMFCNDKKVIASVKKDNKVKIKALKESSKWVNTPFGDRVLPRMCAADKKEIHISNTPIKDKYGKFLTVNGDYSAVLIGGTFDKYYKAVASGKTLSEDEILYMPDYAGGSSVENLGFLCAGMPRQDFFVPVCGSWQGGSIPILVLINRDKGSRNAGNEIMNALRSGNLAVIDGDARLFKDRGLCLIDLEALYLGGR